jgi:hypothetical protein
MYIYVFFTYSRYTCQKNTIPRVYIPHLCLLGMYKSYIPQGMYKTLRILYVLSMVPRHLGALVILPIYIGLDYFATDDRIIFYMSHPIIVPIC